MRGAILPLPNTPSWSGAQLKRKHNDNFTFTLSYYFKSKRMRREGNITRVGAMVGTPEGKRPRGRPRRRWKNMNNI
jgi:hypothetical protein